MKLHVHETLYYALASDSIHDGKILNISRQKAYNLGYGVQKLNAAHPVNYFPGFLGKILKIAHPVIFSYSPRWYFSKFNPEKTQNWSLGRSKLTDAQALDYFHGFWAIILRITH